eukprot:753572-Hanusia_phi.AAC.12
MTSTLQACNGVAGAAGELMWRRRLLPDGHVVHVQTLDERGGCDMQEVPRSLTELDARIVIVGTIAHSAVYGKVSACRERNGIRVVLQVELMEEAVLVVDRSGKIVLLKELQQLEDERVILWLSSCPKGSAVMSGELGMELVALARGQILVPGFIDTHIHAPQYCYTGTATDLPLMEWLQRYTFPAESSLRDVEKARQVYSSVLNRTLSNGTTCALYFATIHLQSCMAFAELAASRGQRAYIGKVCMDSLAPADYIESTEESLESTEKFIQFVQGLGSDLVHPVVTPRFIPSCSMELLNGLGALADRYDCHVQSHISESLDEISMVKSRYPHLRSDTTIFDTCGLLHDKTIMAHGVHLDDEDLRTLRKRGTSIAHCPLSNFFFADGVLPAGNIVALGNKVSLGTDVAGGYSPSMLNAMRNAVIAHQVTRNLSAMKSDQSLDWRHAFHLATMGGAKALGIEAQVGSLDQGKCFDAVLLDAGRGGIDLWDTDTSLQILEKLINLGSEVNVAMVWVKGRVVHKQGEARPVVFDSSVPLQGTDSDAPSAPYSYGAC